MKSKIKQESCCGSEAYLYILTNPVLKEHVKLFEDEGFIIMTQYLKSGILQAMNGKLNATVTFGNTRINTRCYGKNCSELFKKLENVISKIEHV